MDSGAWWATVHGIAKRWTQLSNQHFHNNDDDDEDDDKVTDSY